MKDKVYTTLINLCIDICKRYGKKKLLWFANKNKSLNYSPASDEMLLTVHRWFANKSCPGDWLYSRLGDVAAKVTAALGTDTTTEQKPDTPYLSHHSATSSIRDTQLAWKLICGLMQSKFLLWNYTYSGQLRCRRGWCSF